MNKNAKKWVKALRSGKYKQGQGWLATFDGSYCCLGVACVVAKVRTEGRAFLPPLMIDWLGLSEGAGGFSGGSLVELNDAGKTFSEIADIIESEPEGLFLHSKAGA